MRPLTTITLTAAALLLTGCGDAPTTTSTTTPGAQANAADNFAPRERLDYSEICPDLVRHNQAGVELVQEFLTDPQAMADARAQTTPRFDDVINQLNRDLAIIPASLVPLVEIQRDQLREVKTFTQTGGSRQWDFTAYRSAAEQTLLQCGHQMSPTVQFTPPPTTTTPPPGPADSFYAGTHVVGTDITPGSYRTTGPASADGYCYWARLEDTSGEFDAIITNGAPEGPATVTIQESDGAFETSGCGQWTKTG